MKWLSRNLSLHTKFNIFIYLGIFILFLNFPLIYLDITSMNDGILNLELTEDLYNTILEMRRYEKNFFLYHNRDDLESMLYYFKQTKKLSSKRSNQLEESHFDPNFVRLIERLADYGGFFHISHESWTPNAPDEYQQNQIRTTGKTVVDLAKGLLKKERQHVGRLAKNALRWPLIFMGTMFCLFLMGATMTTKRVIKPLVKIENATEKIAKGDFSPIPPSGRMESQVDHLIAAFNRMARELEAREEQVIHSRKVASLGTLVSGVAHELNNPINNIVLSVDVLVGRRKISEERRTILLDDILRQALRASEIVKNLLEFSRSETSGYKELNLAELLRDTIQIAENHIVLSRVRLYDEIDDNLPKINGNRQGLQQVFLNLITNAVQAMPRGGDLTIRASLEDTNRIRIQVQDTGRGISEEHLPHIFDPFFTTKDVGKGTGLGLSVSYGVVRKHGGKIGVKSKVGEGTTFTVVLPVHERTDHG